MVPPQKCRLCPREPPRLSRSSNSTLFTTTPSPLYLACTILCSLATVHTTSRYHHSLNRERARGSFKYIKQNISKTSLRLQWIRPPSPKYRFGAGVPLTPVNGASEHIVHALLPGVAQEGGPAMMYGSTLPQHIRSSSSSWATSALESSVKPGQSMYQQTNVMGSEAAKAPDVPKYSAVKR